MQTQTQPTQRTRQWYARMAEEYCATLTHENLMEATAQATQRAITLSSLAVMRTHLPQLHVFNELLVQYIQPERGRLIQAVPDNMVVLHPSELDVDGSFDLELQPARPFWMLEYVSPHNRRKDYDLNQSRYLHDLCVPYYLLFDPHDSGRRTLFLYACRAGRTEVIRPNAAGRLALPEIEVEVGLLDGWVRFWFRGELIPLTAEMVAQLATTRAALAQAEERVDVPQRELDRERQERLALEAELIRLRGSDRPSQ